jgi:hypothetical protein
MLVRVRDTGEVMYLPQWEQTFPETSFPNPIPTETINEFGADVVLDGPYPTATRYQTISSGPVVALDGNWYTSFIVNDMEQEAKDAVDASLKQSNKDKAAKLLDETDWTQVSDCPLLNKQEFIDYRAIVRAIALNPTIDAVFPELPTNQWS